MAETKKTTKAKVSTKKAEYPTMALKELHKKVLELRQESVELRRNSHMGDVQNVTAYKYKRRELARALTALNAKREEKEK
jgi:ribosomal protein L29